MVFLLQNNFWLTNFTFKIWFQKEPKISDETIELGESRSLFKNFRGKITLKFKECDTIR